MEKLSEKQKQIIRKHYNNLTLSDISEKSSSFFVGQIEKELNEPQLPFSLTRRPAKATVGSPERSWRLDCSGIPL